MDIRVALQSRGIQFIQSPNDANEIRINCIYCVSRGYSQDFRQRLGINIKKNYAHCFNCKYKSRRALQTLGKKLELGQIDPTLIETDEEKPKEKIKLPEDFESLAGKQDDEWGSLARIYLDGRGVTESQIKKHKIGYSLMGRYKYRVIFPIYVWYDGIKGKKRKLEGIVSRSFVDREPRYLNSYGVKTVFNIPSESRRWYRRVKRNRRQILVITEGILKALALERSLSSVNEDIYCCALLGHTMTERQEDLITPDRWDEVVMWPDPDLAGIRGFVQISEQMRLKATQDDTGMTLSIVNPGSLQADDMAHKQRVDAYAFRMMYEDIVGLNLQYEASLREKEK